jgi:phosphoribosylaminoimidazole-succinocarboxamide synthase
MLQTLGETNFQFPVPHQKLYRGKVRDVYTLDEQLMVFVASDRISAFDHILPRAIPSKGQVLNQTAAYFLNATRDICPNHLLATPDPNVTIGRKCEAYPVEVVVRGYLSGHAWRTYREGGRLLCGVTLPEGLKENDAFPEPIITPATKSTIGHDIDISEGEITRSGLVPPEEWAQIRHYALQLYVRGQKMACERGLILVDTKYEFGMKDFDIILIDEIHTPDSSRYFYLEGYEGRQKAGEPQKQLSKEFVREWLIEHGFQGLEGQLMPEMPDSFVEEVTRRYIEVYETVTGEKFVPRTSDVNLAETVFHNTLTGLRQLGAIQ